MRFARLNILLSALFPTFGALFGIFVAGALLNFIGAPELILAGVMVWVFFWSLYQRSLLPPLSVFIIGIACDIVGLFPIGLSAFILLFLQMILSSQQKLLRDLGFLETWGIFCLFSGGASLLFWLLASLMSGFPLSFQPMLLFFFCAAVVYPLLTAFLSRIHRYIFMIRAVRRNSLN